MEPLIRAAAASSDGTAARDEQGLSLDALDAACGDVSEE